MFIELDGLADLMEDSWPWLEAYAVLLAMLLVALVATAIGRQFRHSPTEELLRSDRRERDFR